MDSSLVNEKTELLTEYSSVLVINIETYTEPPLLNKFVKPV